MASSKKPKEEEKKKTKKNDNSAVKEIKKAIKSTEKKTSSTKTPTKSKPTPKPKPKPKPKQKSKPENNKSKNKSSNGTLALVESEDTADPSSSTESKQLENGKKASKNVKPNKRKQKEKVEENEEEGEATMCRFPMSRIKRIMKSEDYRMAVSQDVVFLVNKATEKFLEKFCEDGYKSAVKDHKKSLGYKHLSTVVRERSRYDFLSDYVPEKIKAEDALKERNLTEKGTG